MTRTILAAALIGLFARGADARQCTPQTTDEREPFSFIVTAVDSFAYISTNADKEREPGTSLSNEAAGPIANIASYLLTLKRESEDYQCAGTLMGGFRKSKDQNIAMSAKGMAMTYLKLHLLNDQMAKLLSDVLDGKASTSAVVDRASSFSVERDETYRLLLDAASLALFALVAEPADGEITVPLTITEAQRLDLMRKLEGTYGESVKKGFVPGVKLNDAPGHLVYAWLRDAGKHAPSK